MSRRLPDDYRKQGRIAARIPGPLFLCILIAGFAWPGPVTASERIADQDWHIPWPGAAEAVPATAVPELQRLEQARLHYAALVAAGGWPALPPEPELRPGDRAPDVRTLRELLRATGDYRAEIGADPWFFDGALMQALQRLQHRHGLPATGWPDAATRSVAAVAASERLAQIEVAIERWHWLPRERGARHLWVNIPAATLDLIEDGESVLSMPVIVGHPRRPTPSLRSEIRAVEFRPAWTVPRRLAVEDLLPLQQRDPAFLDRQRIRVLHITPSGRQPVPPEQVRWEELGPDRFPYVLVQDPGPANSLGLVRFVMDNPFDIYLHDTPAQGFFGLRTRTLSAGCVRLPQALALADTLLGRERSDWPAGQAAERTAAPGLVRLQERVPVYLVYLTSWVTPDGQVHFRPDIYDRDHAVLAALRERAGAARSALRR